MLAAGHETTSTGLAFAFELLLRNRGVLERLREELAAGDGDAYLDAVVKESLRLRPVIDGAERTLTKPRTLGGWALPPGVKVYPGILLTHMRADLYPEPERFRPERFLDDGAESYAWLPFGGGIRRCLGAALAQAEMAEVLRVVVPAVELRACAGGARPGGDARYHARAEARRGGHGGTGARHRTGRALRARRCRLSRWRDTADRAPSGPVSRSLRHPPSPRSAWRASPSRRNARGPSCSGCR